MESLHDSQLEFVLLRSTLALPKFIYILCTVDPTNHCQLWEEYDGITKVGLERILAGAVTHRVWEMVKLKVNDGGLGLRAAQDHHLVVYAASKLGSLVLVSSILGERGPLALGTNDGEVSGNFWQAEGGNHQAGTRRI